MKILLNIPFTTEYKHYLRIVEAFETNGFEVITESLEWCNHWITQIPAEVIDKAAFVVTINEVLYFHESFWNRVKIYIAKGCTVFGCDNVLYANNDMGLLEVTEQMQLLTFAAKQELLENNVFHIMRKYKNLYSVKPLIACMLNDTQFISKNGKFYNECLTAEILTNGTGS